MSKVGNGNQNSKTEKKAATTYGLSKEKEILHANCSNRFNKGI
jgi:hypothetical protein